MVRDSVLREDVPRFRSWIDVRWTVEGVFGVGGISMVPAEFEF